MTEAMQQLGINPVEIDIKDGLVESLIASRPTRVFNLVHGRPGETVCCKDFCVRLVSPSQVRVLLHQPWHLINRELSKFGSR